jgi:ketosteroid isomerase-like protein
MGHFFAVTPKENVEVVRRFYASWSRRDLDAALECVHPEIEFDWSGSLSPFRGIYRGREGVVLAWTEIMDAWTKFAPEIEKVIECGPERLITPTLVRGQGKASGVQGEAHGAVLWTLREGKIIQGKLFQSKEEALEAVGVSEQDAH